MYRKRRRSSSYSSKYGKKKPRSSSGYSGAKSMSHMERAASRLQNFGDYPIASNSILAGGLKANAVSYAVKNGGVIVRHREYITDIVPTAAFTVQREVPINPGLFQSFPWLAGLAENFEQYDFRGLVFEYVSTSADSILSSGVSTALGTVMMATQYNVLSNAFQTKKELLNYQYANTQKPSSSFSHPCDCRKNSNPLNKLWVRTESTNLTGSDRRLYDLGDFVIATEGCQGTTGSIGELWVTFEVELLKPKLVDLGFKPKQAIFVRPNFSAAAVPQFFNNNIAAFFSPDDSIFQPAIDPVTFVLSFNFTNPDNTPNINTNVGDIWEILSVFCADSVQAGTGGTANPVITDADIISHPDPYPTFIGSGLGVGGAFVSADVIFRHTIRITGPNPTVASVVYTPSVAGFYNVIFLQLSLVLPIQL